MNTGSGSADPAAESDMLQSGRNIICASLAFPTISYFCAFRNSATAARVWAFISAARAAKGAPSPEGSSTYAFVRFANDAPSFISCVKFEHPANSRAAHAADMAVIFFIPESFHSLPRRSTTKWARRLRFVLKGPAGAYYIAEDFLWTTLKDA